MRRSETHVAIVSALALAQGKFGAPVKATENVFKGYRYADLAAVREAVRGPLAEHGLCYTQTTEFREQKLWLVSTLYHTSGEWLGSDYPVFAALEDPQKLGAAITYARRYSLMALLGVAPAEDLDDMPPGAGAGSAPRRDERPRDRERERDAGRDAVNAAFPRGNGHANGRGAAAPAKAPPLTYREFVGKQLAKLGERFKAEFPGVTTELPDEHLVARHLYRLAGQQNPPLLECEPNLKSLEVFNHVNRLYRTANGRAFVLAELKRYLPAKLEEARLRAQAALEASAGREALRNEALRNEAEDEGLDPDDAEYPDEPGSDG